MKQRSAKANYKKLIIGLMLVLPLQLVNGQDKIVTVGNDTIVGHIVSISPTHIRYEQRTGNRLIGKFIPIEQVQEYFSQPKTLFLKPASPWQIGLQAGGAHITPSSTDAEREMQNMGVSQSEAKKYYKHLKNGLYLSGNVHYWFNESIGAGLKYSLFSSSADMELPRNILPASSNPYDRYVMGINERLYVNYVGPSVITGQWLNPQHTFQLTESFSVGYVHYRDEVRFNPYQYVLISPNGNPVLGTIAEGKTWGGNVEIAFAYYPLKWLSVTANAGFFSAQFKELEVSTAENSYTQELDKDHYENVSRLNASIGVQFHF